MSGPHRAVMATDFTERARLASIAIAEVVPGISARIAADDPLITEWLGVRAGEWEAERDKASRLALLHVKGPEFPCICDAHAADNNDTLWAQCGMVSVASALLGRTCWKAQP